MATQTHDAPKPRERVSREESPAPGGSGRGDFFHVTPHGGEELVADARAGVTPEQMVERKVLAALGGGDPGRVAQATGDSSNPRRVPGAPVM